MTQNADKLKRTQIKPYTLDKQYKVYVDGICVISYDDVNLAWCCCYILSRDNESVQVIPAL